jgi:hypothetical protein
MLAEFAYAGKVTPSFPFLDPRTNSRLWWFGKTFGFPWLYWHIMVICVDEIQGLMNMKSGLQSAVLGLNPCVLHSGLKSALQSIHQTSLAAY